MNMKFLLLIMVVFATDENKNGLECETESREQTGEQSIVVKIEEDEYTKQRSNYIGAYYQKRISKWVACRRSKNESKIVYNGTFKDEETAAHASDTLARKLIANGEKGHKLNFPDDDTDVYSKEKSSKFFGVYYNKKVEMWRAYRYSKTEKKHVYNGYHKDEETAAHASDTLARKLTENGEKGHPLNFPDDNTEVYPKEKASNYIGVSYNKRDLKWRACRHTKMENKNVNYGTYKDEETAAHASDTLARKLIANGEKGHKLNFPYDDIEVYPGKVAANVKNSSDFNGVTYNKQDLTWSAQRWSKKENKTLNNGSYKDEKSAAHASDTLAKKLIANGEKGHKLNFFDDDTEVHAQEKSCKYIGVSYNKQRKTWLAWRWSKHENRQFYNGSYKDEEMAARASDTLARKLMANGEKVHKLNFPNDDTEVMYQKKKRKRPKHLGNSQDNESY